jgi:diacylglycerol kinase (ATP)
VVVIIINPISGGARAGAGSARAEMARAIVARHEVDAQIFLTEGAGHARALAESAIAGGADRIVAWGGDGTINEIASAVAFGVVPVGIVPAGSGNGLARELNLPFDPTRALDKALGGAERTIDVGEIEGRLFVNVAGIGLDAHVAARFNAAGNVRRGPRTYVAMTARALATYRPQTYDIVTAEWRTTRTALLIVLANGTEFGNRILIARGARVDDGVLDLVMVEERSRLATVCRVPWLLARSIHRVPVWSTRPVREVTIEASEPILFHVDGEPVQGGVRVTARIHPGALKIAM